MALEEEGEAPEFSDEELNARVGRMLQNAERILDTLKATHAGMDSQDVAEAIPIVIAAIARSVGMPREKLVSMVEFAFDNFTRPHPAYDAEVKP